MTKLERKIFDLLDFGFDNPITAEEISKYLSINTRDVTKAIHSMRTKGFFITAVHAGDCQGYFKPSNYYEVLMFVKDMNKRIYNMQKAMKPALDYVTGKTTRKNILEADDYDFYEHL